MTLSTLLPWEEEGCLASPPINWVELPPAGGVRSVRKPSCSVKSGGDPAEVTTCFSFFTGVAKQLILLLQKLFWFSILFLSLVESQEGEKSRGQTWLCTQSVRPPGFIAGPATFLVPSPGKPPCSRHSLTPSNSN